MVDKMATSGMRWVGWVLVMAVVGPLFAGELRLKMQVLSWTRKVLLACAIGSVMAYFLGLRFSGRGLFFGLMGHTMILAPVSALAAIDLFCTRKFRKSRWQPVLTILCCLVCVGAGSRGAVLGLTVGILTHVAHRREGIAVLFMACLAMGAIGLVQPDDTYGVAEADLGAGLWAELTAKGTNDTRGHLWAARIEEFRESPVVGVGFQEQKIYRLETAEKFIEPGSSYLAILSMTGLMGATGFVWVVTTIAGSLYTRNCAIPAEYRDLLRGWIAFFSVHLVIEGYIFSCGSLISFLFWLAAGCTVSLDYRGRLQQRRQKMLAGDRSSLVRGAA